MQYHQDYMESLKHIKQKKHHSINNWNLMKHLHLVDIIQPTINKNVH